eukprot:8366350-Pyramimonas_sp.AAC.1
MRRSRRAARLDCFWGALGSPKADWSDCVFTDGSGCQSDVSELRRCGWSSVVLGANGVPARAVRARACSR